MDWRRLGTLHINEVGGTVQRLTLPMASPLLRVRGLVFDIQQIHYRKLGYLRLLTLSNEVAKSSILLQQASIIEVPKWLDMFLIEVEPVPYLVSAQVVIDGLTPESMAGFDYIEVPVDVV